MAVMNLRNQYVQKIGSQVTSIICLKNGEKRKIPVTSYSKKEDIRNVLASKTTLPHISIINMIN